MDNQEDRFEEKRYTLGSVSPGRTDNFYNFRLRNARINRGYTVVKLADLVSVSPMMVYNWEKLRSFPSQRNVRERLAVILLGHADEALYLFPEEWRPIKREVHIERDNLNIGESIEDHLSVNNLDDESVLLAQDNCRLPKDILEVEEIRSKVRTALEYLPEKHRDVLKLRFGIGLSRQYSLDEISKLYRFSKEGIRRVEIKGFQRLRALIGAKKLFRNLHSYFED